jgi:prephenate dehydratase
MREIYLYSTCPCKNLLLLLFTSKQYVKFTDMSERLVFATQGDEYSYHAEAARRLAGEDIGFLPFKDFSDVVRSSRLTEPGLGVIAISTVAGTVDDSARQLVRKRVAALPPVVARVDLPIKLALIGAYEMTEDELAAQGVRLLAQKAAYLQCESTIRQIAPKIKHRYEGESILAVREALRLSNKKHKNPNKRQHPYIAIGPAHAAEPLGGVIVGPDQVNPLGSVTSFYALQRQPRDGVLIPADPEKTAKRTIVSLAHPDIPGEFTKAMQMTQDMGIEVTRFIRFNIGDFTKHNPTLKRGGGIFEIIGDDRDEKITEWISRAAGIEGNDGATGPFDINPLGFFDWYPEEPIDLAQLAATREAEYAEKRRQDAADKIGKWMSYLREIA